MHRTAAGFASADSGPAAGAADDDNLLLRYGFTSLDALEYLLALEEEFGITFEDEDLNEEVLSSADRLADYIMSRR
jgi:acyl carrier protein